MLLLVLLAGACRRVDAQEAVITRGPYLQALVDDSVEVRWITEQASVGAVRYWKEGGEPQTVTEVAPGTDHRLGLSDLLPGTRYFYEVLDFDAVLTGEFRFRTAPPANEGTVRIAVIGDSGNASLQQQAVAEVIRDMAPDLFLHTGDLDYLGFPDITVFEPYRDILPNTCLYPSRGNHDIFPWSSFFTPPEPVPGAPPTYYSFDWGSAHFVTLDTGWGLQPGSHQLEWLVQDLEKAQEAGRNWTILCFHYCLYTVGAYAWDPDLKILRDTLTPVFDRFEVDLVLMGHDHNYQRSYPIRGDAIHDAWQEPSFTSPASTLYVVTGGGGAVLYPALESTEGSFIRVFEPVHHVVQIEMTPSRLEVRAVGIEGEVYDEFTISKEAARPAISFLRGDVDFNGRLELTDAIRMLGYLFLGEPIDCPAVGEVNGSGLPPGLTDPIYLLNFLFQGGPPPAPPFPECAPAPDDDAGCLRAGCGPVWD
jgi:hypothetical protein